MKIKLQHSFCRHKKIKWSVNHNSIAKNYFLRKCFDWRDEKLTGDVQHTRVCMSLSRLTGWLTDTRKPLLCCQKCGRTLGLCFSTSDGSRNHHPLHGLSLVVGTSVHQQTQFWCREAMGRIYIWIQFFFLICWQMYSSGKKPI